MAKKKWFSGNQLRAHKFDPRTMGKDKKAAGLEYWNRRLNKTTDGSTPTPLTWKQIKAHGGFKKGEFNKFYSKRPENLREARDRYESRVYQSKKLFGDDHTPGQPKSWKEIKAHKNFKAGSYQDKLKRKRKARGSTWMLKEENPYGKAVPNAKPPATPPADEQQS